MYFALFTFGIVTFSKLLVKKISLMFDVFRNYYILKLNFIVY